jgi:hypothetical protein
VKMTSSITKTREDQFRNKEKLTLDSTVYQAHPQLLSLYYHINPILPDWSTGETFLDLEQKQSSALNRVSSSGQRIESVVSLPKTQYESVTALVPKNEQTIAENLR